MRGGGIFSGLSGDLGGQTLSLRTINGAGQTTANPLAAAVQTILSRRDGAKNLVVDGKWGDCSQRAFINTYGSLPTPKIVEDVTQLWRFGSPTIKVWEKSSPVCYSPEAEVDNNAYNPSVEPAIIVANMLGLPIPAGVCDEGLTPNLTTGACDSKTKVSIVKTSSPVDLSKLQVTSSGVQRIAAPLATQQPIVKGIIPQTSKFSTSTISQVSLTQPTSMISSLNLSRLFGGSEPSEAPAAGAGGTGMSGGAKLAVALLAIAAIGGVFWWQRSKSAVPNCGFYPNCGE